MDEEEFEERPKKDRTNYKKFFGWCGKCQTEISLGEIQETNPSIERFEIRVDYKCPRCNTSLCPF